MYRRTAGGVAVALTALALAACSTTSTGSTSPPSGPASSAARSVTAGMTLASATPLPATPLPATPRSAMPQPQTQTITVSTVTRTLTSTNVFSRVTLPPRSPEPPAQERDCPYLTNTSVAAITGQRVGRTTIIAIGQHPVCTFYRRNGDFLGEVRVTVADSPAQAVAIVDQAVPVEVSQLGTQPPGWTGGFVTGENGSVYGVSKSRWAVIARQNEQPSIKARTLAVCSIYGLRLQAAPPPDYCKIGS